MKVFGDDECVHGMIESGGGSRSESVMGHDDGLTAEAEATLWIVTA